MNELKKIFFEEYGGFADKRIKNLNKASKFIVDDRESRDFASDGKLYSYFCSIETNVDSNYAISVALGGNIPSDELIDEWVASTGFQYVTDCFERNRRLILPIEKENYVLLSQLADKIDGIISRRGKWRVPSNYIYVCPRTASSLKRLSGILNRAWGKNLLETSNELF